MDRSLDLIIAEGNEHPIHPQWLRSLRDQCKDVVPFNFAGWGRWAPVYDPGDFLGAALNDEHAGHQDTGKERSGRLLDGQEHNGRLT